jgi:hypothetical protein
MRFDEFYKILQEDIGYQPNSVNDNEKELDEANWDRMSRGWIILPATMALYGKRVVTLQEAVSEWGDGTIYICAKDENGRQRILFVYSSGQEGDDKVGKTYEAFHDQTHASKGFYTVLNVAHFENNELVRSVNNIGLNVKASLAVFK